jgi:proline dehydrogenase
MEKYQISKNSGVVSFAQLYGMNDFITYSLASNGYEVYKYIPFGPLEDVIPYLLRRVQENKAILESKNDGFSDITLIMKEIKRRITVI